MQTHKYISIIFSLMLLWLGTWLVGCSGDDGIDASFDGGTGECYIQLNLSTNTKSSTRASEHPYGGETGDGTEQGRNHENDINNINIFIYNSTIGVNDAENTEIKFAKYFSYLDLIEIVAGEEYETKPMLVRGYKPAPNDRIIVLVNMGDMTETVDADHNKTITLGEVRNAMVNSAWGVSGTSIKDYYNFAMASAIDNTTEGTVNVSAAGTYAEPFSANVTVERVAARIDFCFDKAQTASSYRNPIVYDVEGTSDKFRLSHIRIVNGSQMPTFTLKRTATTVSPSLTGITYLGDETVATGTTIPTNYVVEPTTHLKNASTPISSANLTTWFGASSLMESLDKSFLASSAYKVHSTATDEEVFEADGNYCYTLGYVMENTMDKSSSNNVNLMTAIEIKGTYIPATVYKWDEGTNNIIADGTYAAGNDFWYYDNHTTPANSYAFSSEADLLTYASKHTGIDYEMRHYVNGECYYYVWIRHAMFDEPTYPTGTYPMEFGIVRNNIYRIHVGKVMKLGPATPTPEVPDLLYSHIHVRKWRFRAHKEIFL
ncbi:MAG: Mfa1 family fimbria major subunit [Prevotellaceae bacterium]|nr:Mfa1 family fimbria major subunit [Prevotellaceae bacterium]